MVSPKALYLNLCPLCLGNFRVEGNETKCENNCNIKNSFFLNPIEKEFLEFFKTCIGEPRALQKLWAKRVFRGESFAIVAPTGIGKTSFGAITAFYLASKGKKAYIILPTTLLVEQIVNNLKSYAAKVNFKASFNEGGNLTILFFHSNLDKESKSRFEELIKNHRFQLLITTSQFLSKAFKKLDGLTFDFIFVDDVDAILKASKNVEKVLQLLGLRKVERSWIGFPKGTLMVSTATIKPGLKAKLFRKLLNFDVGASTYIVRNIEDIIVLNKSIDSIKRILKIMGKGGLLYALSVKEAEEIYESLKNEFKIGLVSAKRKSDYNLFEEGKIDYLIGTAFYYGTLVRGLDLPEKIRYAVFIGAPIIRVKAEDVTNVTPKMLKVLALIFRREDSIKKYLPIIQAIDKSKYDREREELKKEIAKLLELGKGKAELDVVIRRGEIIFPDLKTYIQGSGRTSRLFTGGLTKGASFLLESDEEILKAFMNRAELYDLKFKNLNEIDFNILIKEIDESRAILKEAKSCEEVIKPAVLIVESPTKARQISRFFGYPATRVIKEGGNSIILYEVPTNRYILTVTASLGHLVDLVTNQGFFGVSVNGDFTPLYTTIKHCRKCLTQFTEDRDSCPKCGSKDIDDAKNRINVFRRLAEDAGFVIVGTDPDSEGEKIAWDIKNLLSRFSIVKRAEFHEVTKRAVQEALENLKDVNENLVKAQIVRRIEDRWIGFALSQKLWKTFNNVNLSAGRAQTPVLGWIVEKAKESRKRIKVGYISELDLSIENLDKEWVNVKVVKVKEEEREAYPLPPYTTDAMLKDGCILMKASAKEIMRLAQDLFENGLITYHRTDSTRVSDLGKRIAKEFLGENYQGREWFSEGAHECIRPTRALPKDVIQRLIQEGIIQTEKITSKHLMLYDLIFKRFMASQCKPFLLKINKYVVYVDGEKIEKEIVTEAYGKAIELYKWNVQIKRPLPEGEFKFKVKVKYVPKAFPYTQSELIREMREKGIGRPSTYATILDKIFLRGYSFERKGRVLPTKKGIQVYYFLKNNYEKFVSEERTRLLEDKMDSIEKGEAEYNEVLTELYNEIMEIT